jgi:hypothetical protein
VGGFAIYAAFSGSLANLSILHATRNPCSASSPEDSNILVAFVFVTEFFRAKNVKELSSVRYRLSPNISKEELKREEAKHQRTGLKAMGEAAGAGR